MTKSLNKGIIFTEKEELKLIKYSNFDWAGDYGNEKSISRFIFMLNSRLGSYAYRKQTVVALLSTKVEYIALSLIAQEVI